MRMCMLRQVMAMPPENTMRIIRKSINSSAQLNGRPKKYRPMTLAPLIATIHSKAAAAIARHTRVTPRRGSTMPRARPAARLLYIFAHAPRAYPRTPS